MRDEERAKVLYLSCIKFCKIRMPVTKMTSSQRYIQKDTRRSFLKKEKRKRKKKEKRRIATRRNYWTDSQWLSKKKKLLLFNLFRLKLHTSSSISVESVMPGEEKKMEWSLNELLQYKKINWIKYENFQYSFAKMLLEIRTNLCIEIE